jgi:hypothetical protein
VAPRSHEGEHSADARQLQRRTDNRGKYKSVPPFQETRNYVRKITGLLDVAASHDWWLVSRYSQYHT